MEDKIQQLNHFADILEENADTLCRILKADVGITTKAGKNRDLKSSTFLIRQMTAGKFIKFDPNFDLQKAQPYGKVAALLPYNSVFMALALAMASAYLVGNEVFVHFPSKLSRLKPLLKEILQQTLSGVEISDMSGKDFLNHCIENEDIQVIICFGDDKWISRYYRKIRNSHTKFLFEGPGKDPFVIFKNANLEKAAKSALMAGFANSGQSCSSPERFYVHKDIYSDFVSQLLKCIDDFTVGPQADGTEPDIGPLGSFRVVENIKNQFTDAVIKGAKSLRGGYFRHFDGDNFPTCMPTILSDCSHEMSIMMDETFGPVIPLHTFENEEEVLNLVNDSSYGLTATIFGGSKSFVTKLQDSYGTVFHNSCITDPENADSRMFWGGFGNSGWIWEWKGRNFIMRKGPRLFPKEFSRD